MIRKIKWTYAGVIFFLVITVGTGSNLLQAASPIGQSGPLRMIADGQPISNSLSALFADAVTPTPTIDPAGSSSSAAGFDDNPINPLTGLPVTDPALLEYPPALVSITNFPLSARPQAGLSYSSHVYEFFIGDGMARFLAVFYGEYPPNEIDKINNQADDEASQSKAIIGPIRSGRLPYEHIRKLYNGFIVMASAQSKVASQLKESVNVYGTDLSDPNSALMPVEELAETAKSSQKNPSAPVLDGNIYSSQPPEGGKDAQSLWVFYSYFNQIFWRYNQQDGSYHRWQDNTDATTFVEQTDRLNGEALTYENVILLFADFKGENEYTLDNDLLYIRRGKALLFRDGQTYDIYWSTTSQDYEKTTGKLRPIRYIDAQGNPFPLKPGQTWIHVMPPHIAVWETVDSEVFNRLTAGRSKGSGFWAAYFKLGF